MYSRHDLVWLSAAGWDQVRAATLADEHTIVGQWQQQDWPAIVRSAEPAMHEDDICLGIAVAPDRVDGHKRKIAIRARSADVAARQSPLPLRDVIAAAPPAWQHALAALDAALPGLRVYGSLALQVLTGQSYVTASSDIDLLFAPSSEGVLRAGLAVLAEFSASLPLDGEIIFPSGEAVSWKEWMIAKPAGNRVLVKAHHAVRLSSCPALLASFGR